MCGLASILMTMGEKRVFGLDKRERRKETNMEKKRIWKRVLSSVLALAMVVTSLTISPREAKAATDKVIIPTAETVTVSDPTLNGVTDAGITYSGSSGTIAYETTGNPGAFMALFNGYSDINGVLQVQTTANNQAFVLNFVEPIKVTEYDSITINMFMCAYTTLETITTSVYVSGASSLASANAKDVFTTAGNINVEQTWNLDLTKYAEADGYVRNITFLYNCNAGAVSYYVFGAFRLTAATVQSDTKVIIPTADTTTYTGISGTSTKEYDFNGTDFNMEWEEQTGALTPAYLVTQVTDTSSVPSGYTGGVYGGNGSTGQLNVPIEFNEPLEMSKILSIKVRMYMPEEKNDAGTSEFRIYTYDLGSYTSAKFADCQGTYGQWCDVDITSIIVNNSKFSKEGNLTRFVLGYRDKSANTAMVYYDKIIIEYADVAAPAGGALYATADNASSGIHALFSAYSDITSALVVVEAADNNAFKVSFTEPIKVSDYSKMTINMFMGRCEGDASATISTSVYASGTSSLASASAQDVFTTIGNYNVENTWELDLTKYAEADGYVRDLTFLHNSTVIGNYYIGAFRLSNPKEYKTLTFKNWGIDDGTYMGTIPTELSDGTTSLDGYAFEGIVNFNGRTDNVIRIGGTTANSSNIYVALQLSFTGENTLYLYNHFSGNEKTYTINNGSYTKDTRIRLTFDETAENEWNVGVRINNVDMEDMQLTNTNLGTGLFVMRNSSDTTEPGTTVQSVSTEKEYKTLTFSDWGLKDGTYSDAARNFALKDESITSLDGYAIEGYVNYHASGSYLKVGGIDSNPHYALQVWATGTNQIALYNHLNGDNGQPVFTPEGFSNSADTKIRLTFNETATNTWTVGFYVNDEYVGEMNLTNSALGTRMLYGGDAITVASTVGGTDVDNGVNYEEYLTPIWEGTTVYDESVMPLYNADGSMSPITLAYAIDEIVSVKSADLQTTYTAGTDYTVENGKLVIPSGSAIPVTQYSEYYFDTPTGNAYPTTDGGYMYFSEDGWFHDRQIVVTYTHSDTWGGSVPKKQGQNLTNVQEKLENKEPITVAFYGDSITEGANSSAFLKKKPRLETYAELTVEAMRRTYGYEEIYYVNTALGGQTTAWGAENAQNRVAMHEPDLLFIAFGMNDPVTLEADYKASIESIINTVRADNADCDIVLVGTMLPNEEAGNNTYGNQVEFVNVLNTIAGEYSNVVVADMTNMHKSLLEMKSYRDMTGNNVNHPNDFLGRVYAQVLMETIDVRAAGEGYTELSFNDWDNFVEYNSLVKGNVYSLSNNVVSSLDGVAISGKVNFATEGVYLRIGGTDAVKHGGFWMWKASNGLHLSPQGIGETAAWEKSVVSGDTWEAVKDSYFELRMTFDKVDNGWTIGVYVNGELTFNETIEQNLTPGLYMGIGSGIYVDMVDEDEIYQELTFVDWDIYDGIVPYPKEHKDYLHQLKYKNITSLEGYALSGTIAFNGGYWRIGTHEDSTYYGLQFQVNGSTLQMVNWLDATAPTIDIYTFIDNEAIASKVPLRIEFETVSSSAMRIHVYVYNSHKRTLDLTINAQVSGSTVQAGTNLLSSNTNGTMKVYSDKKTYKELTFSDYEGYSGTANVGFLLEDGKVPVDQSIYVQKYNWEPDLNGCALTGRIIFGTSGEMRFAGTNSGGFHGVGIASDGNNLRFINHKNFAETNSLPALYSGDDAATREFLIRIQFDEVTDTKLAFTIYLDGIIKQSYVFTNTLADYPFGAALYFNNPADEISVKSVENAAQVFEDGIYVKDLTKSFVFEKDAVLINGHLRTEYSAGSKVTLGRGIYQMFYKEQMTLETCDIYAYVQGDLNVDENGVCGAADIVRAKKVLKEQEELSRLGMLAGDFNLNGAFDEIDLTMLRTHVLSANELVMPQRPAADCTVDLLGDTLNSAVESYTTESWGAIDALNPEQADIYDTNKVTLDWVAIAGATYKVYVSGNKDMSNAILYETDEATLELYNLVPDTTYYWKVEAISTNDVIVTGDVMSFATKDGKVRTIVIDGLPNIRDIGGLTSADGTKRIKYGMLYRGGKANYITELGESQAAMLGVRTELDLRANNGEAVDTKSFGENVNYINIPGVHYSLQVEDNWSTIVEELRVFADPSAYPVYFHCSLGRDRTGTLAFLLEALAGVSEDDLMLDYELSRLSYIGSATATNEDLLPNYMNMYNVIKTYDGATFQEETWNYLKAVGLTETELSMIYDNITEDVVEEGAEATGGYERTALYYGLGEPCSDFPASNSESYVTKEFTAEVAGGFGVSTYRIWLPSLAYTRVAEEGSTTAVAGYEIGFFEEDLAKAKEWVALLKENGVKQILLCQTNFLTLDDQPYFILDDGRAVSQKDIREKYGNAYPEGTTAVYADSNAVPEPGTEEYEAFLAVQQAYYDMLIDEIPGITHIEAMNEPEGNGAIRRFGSACVHSAWTTPDRFTVDELAQVCMDYCYAINKGVSGKNVKVLAPALMTVEGREGVYNSSDVLTAFYNYIANAEDKTIDNYFQILNWHPYVHIAGGGDEDKMVIAGVDNWDAWNDGEGMDWVTYQKNLYQIALDAGDYNTPVWFTEFGQTDLDDEEHEKLGYGAYPELEITEEKVATRFSEMLDLAASELPFVQTVMAFRIADWKIPDDEFTMDNLTEIGEANYGMIESFQNETSADACLKEIGKTYFDIINGTGTDREKILAVIRKYYNAYKG